MGDSALFLNLMRRFGFFPRKPRFPQSQTRRAVRRRADDQRAAGGEPAGQTGHEAEACFLFCRQFHHFSFGKELRERNSEAVAKRA